MMTKELGNNDAIDSNASFLNSKVSCEPNTKADNKFIDSEIKRLTEANDPVRLEIVETLQQLWPQGIEGNRYELTCEQRLSIISDLTECGFDATGLESISGYAISLFAKIHEKHILNKQPPARINYTTPDKSDDAVRRALQRDSEVLNMAFPNLGLNVVDQSIICKGDDGHYRSLNRIELKHPELAAIDRTLCAVPPDRARKTLEYEAAKNPVHPLREEFDKCKHEYKGIDEQAIELVESIPKLLMSNDHPIPNMIIRNLLFSQAALVVGEQSATVPLFVPVLAGEQGTYKSSFWESLSTLGLPHLKNNYAVCSSTAQQLTSDITLRSTAPWMELAELERFLTPANVDSFKNLVTDTHPLGRRPYDVAATRFKRMSVWVGSTNHPTAVCVDRSSPYDRRIIPIWIPSGTFIDIDQMNARVREIWGAVMRLYEKGYCISPQGIPSNLYADLGSYQQDFVETTPREQSLIDYARGVNIVVPSEACVRALGMTENAIEASDVREARNIYKNILPDMGFIATRVRANGRRLSVFTRNAKSKLNPVKLQEVRSDINRGRSAPIDWPVDHEDNGDF